MCGYFLNILIFYAFLMVRLTELWNDKNLIINKNHLTRWREVLATAMVIKIPLYLFQFLLICIPYFTGHFRAFVQPFDIAHCSPSEFCECTLPDNSLPLACLWWKSEGQYSFYTGFYWDIWFNTDPFWWYSEPWSNGNFFH